MPTFEARVRIAAPLAAVRAFHGSTDVLRRLTPPPMFVRIHEFGALREGMIARFTLWLGPLPIRWEAEHVDVSDLGFTDVQRQGPARAWRHTHRFEPDGPDATVVHDRIEFEHHPGARGLITRLLFARLNLRVLFAYRAWVTSRGARRLAAAGS